ncbi:MAG: YabP/YqfC family sporulation protein [Clostridia bacterium]|nr:YabP/YqfC family sporulation protein [Clostridia bacterium]
MGKILLKKAVFTGSDQVILQSGRRLVMENCKKVIYCDPAKMILQGKLRLELEGENLKLLELGNDNVEIKGVIQKITLGGES